MARLLALFIAVTATVAWAVVALDPRLIAAGWQELTFDGRAGNRFLIRTDGGIEVVTDNSVSLLQRPVAVDLAATPRLTWRWRVDQAVPTTDLSVRGGDDRSLAIYVAFPFEPEHSSAFERMHRAMLEQLFGQEAPGRVLNYVWGGVGQRGEIVPSPYLQDSGMLKILRPGDGPIGVWLTEEVDLAADYRETFDSEPPNPIHIAIGADSDDIGVSGRGSVADLVFTRR